MPNRALNVPGYDFIVPFVTHERFLEKIRIGVLVNMGFLPEEFRHPFMRKHMLASNSYLDIFGVVTKNRNLQKAHVFKQGNTEDEQRFSLKNFNLSDFAEFSSLSNKENVGEAVIEYISMDDSKMSENAVLEYNVDLNATQQIPFHKVELTPDLRRLPAARLLSV